MSCRSLILITLTGLFLSACGGTSAMDPEATAPDTSPAPGKKLEAVLAKEYGSFANLKRDSVAVVEVTATGAEVRPVTGGAGATATETVTTATVTRVLWGKVQDQRVRVVQAGDATYDTSESGPLLIPGRSYVVFLTPSASAGIYAITGSITGYELQDGRLVRMTEAARLLPAQLTADEFQQALR